MSTVSTNYCDEVLGNFLALRHHGRRDVVVNRWTLQQDGAPSHVAEKQFLTVIVIR